MVSRRWRRAADAGEHVPQRVEDAIDGGESGRRVVVLDVLGKHLALGGGVFREIGLDVLDLTLRLFDELATGFDSD